MCAMRVARSRYSCGLADIASWTAAPRVPLRYWVVASDPSALRAVLSWSVLRAVSSWSPESARSASSAFSFAPLYWSVAASASS